MKKAVLCGINNYESQSDLRGCINDVNNMAQLLTELFKFEDSNIHKLVNEQVTKTRIKNEWEWLLNNAQEGDKLVFHFSGHGSYVPDDNEDEMDSYDEITCLYDMDFYNSETYLRDDEWNEMTQQIPKGVNLTIIMDNCNSGTGTKAISVNRQGQIQGLFVDTKTSSKRLQDDTFATASSRTSLSPLLETVKNQPNSAWFTEPETYQQLLDNQQLVLPRFLAPPPEFQERLLASARSTGLKTTEKSIDNHLLLAGCEDAQTSADAYIGNDFNGAFTYYLCDCLKQNSSLNSDKLIKKVTQLLKKNRFLQNPQHEGVSLSFFGESPPEPPTNGNSTSQEKPLSIKPNNTLTPENQRLLIQAYRELLTVLSGTALEPTEVKGLEGGQPRYLIYVHGISQHLAGYSDSWWNALKPHVGQTFGSGNLNDTRREVLWSDLVNTRALSEEPEQQQLRAEINAVLEERRRQYIIENSGGGENVRSAMIQGDIQERGGGFSLDDFLVYMLNKEMRQKIIDRFTKVVQPLLISGNQIDIISHSWGTVVAYEGLRELETTPSIQGKVSNFFTVGSALSIGPVRASLRKKNQDGHRPSFVKQWINLDAEGDSVGGMLGDLFQVSKEFLKLTPTGCPRKWYGYDLGCAHGSYFNAQNINVNSDIFAKFILS